MLRRLSLFIFFLTFAATASAQQDVDFHLGAHLLNGVNVLKVKRDFYDPYLWVLAQNNRVYRINSLTMAIDDYTPTFAPYTGAPFVDIAGRSADTVYIATASKVIEFEKGVFRTIDAAAGLSGTVLSIGLDYRSKYAYYNPAMLDIATTTAIYYYNYQKEKITSQGGAKGKNKVFESTYRTMSTSFLGNNYYDTTKQYSVLNLTPITAFFGAVLCHTPEFGDSVSTYYYVTNGYSPLMADYIDDDYLTQVWGNDKGMFQNSWSDSYYLNELNAHYLDGIQVNKITSIFGLLAFHGTGLPSDPGLVHENLLAGTQHGLYFSNSAYGKFIYGFGPIHDYNTFTQEADIGDQPVHDVCVNATSYTTTVCEDAVWVAASDGLYFLKPDYGAYVHPQQFTAINFQGQDNTVSTMNICSGDAIQAEISPGYLGNSYLWYKNGVQIPGKTGSTLSISKAGEYYAVMYDPCSSLHVESNHLTVNIISAPVFTFNYPDKIQQCNSQPYPLSVDNNPAYSYRWYSNGVLNGTTTSSFTVTQSGKYKVEVSGCTNSWVPSKEVEVDMITLPIPEITADKQQYCSEDIPQLTENMPTDPSYTINWYKDGILIPTDKDQTAIQTTQSGSYTVTLASTIADCSQSSAVLPVSIPPAPVFTFNYPAQLQYCAGTPVTLTVNGSAAYQYQWYLDDAPLTGSTGTSINALQNGKYKVEVSSCPGSWIASNEVQVTFIKLGTPVVSFDKASYCAGDQAVVSENLQPDPSYTINWYCNDIAVPGVTNNVSFTADVPGDYKAVLVYNTQNNDGSFCQEISAEKSLVFNPLPTVSIKQTINTTLCAGQTVTLEAQHSAGAVQWSTGETTDQIAVTQPGAYKVTVTSAAGCQADTSISVSFLPDPVFTLKDTSLCTYKNQSITLTAPAGFSAYSWNNGASTQNTFAVNQPGTVSLTVTDANGCQATQQISVLERCASVYIPNTFTPNGDGINDTWAIDGLDESATVKVFTRWGAEVYQSTGYGNPWNGQYNGKQLTPGVYYYLITAKSNTQKLSGSLTIIY